MGGAKHGRERLAGKSASRDVMEDTSNVSECSEVNAAQQQNSWVDKRKGLVWFCMRRGSWRFGVDGGRFFFGMAERGGCFFCKGRGEKWGARGPCFF